jgi:glyoxylase I family protein
MDFPIIDHIVISTTNFKRSIRFYSVFLGKPKTSKFDACWELGDTKLFLTVPYKKSAKAFDKHNIGLNHLAFRVKTLKELKLYEKKLAEAKIKHSGIQIDKYSNKELVWFDDPDGIRLEFYLR